MLINDACWVTATVSPVSWLLKLKRGSGEVVSQKALLYQRNFSSPEDYVWLAPGQSIATSFDLFEWYSLPSTGEFELVVCYQADEPLAPKPDGLLAGTYCSERVAFNVIP